MISTSRSSGHSSRSSGGSGGSGGSDGVSREQPLEHESAHSRFNTRHTQQWGGATVSTSTSSINSSSSSSRGSGGKCAKHGVVGDRRCCDEPLRGVRGHGHRHSTPHPLMSTVARILGLGALGRGALSPGVAPRAFDEHTACCCCRCSRCCCRSRCCRCSRCCRRRSCRCCRRSR